MRVAIDGRAISWTGIGRYVRNLVSHLKARAGNDEYIILIGRKDLDRARHDQAFQSPRVRFHAVDQSYYSWREQTVLLAQLLTVRAEVFHFTHFNLPIFFPRPYVVTVHDVTRFFFSGQSTQSLVSQVAYECIFARSVRRAAAVICVSEATRVELSQLPLPFANAQVIHQGVDSTFLIPPTEQERRAVRELLGTAEPYLLYVGVWMDHKNVRRLLTAFAKARALGVPFRLVMTGEKRPGYVDLPALAHVKGLHDEVIFPGFVPDSLLPALYREASGCLFPSLYEGFGLPPLEAAASNVPVIVSSTASLPEVLGEAALYVNPEYTDDLVRAIMKLTDASLVQGLVARGVQRVSQFSWERAAEAHWSLYRTVLK